jgi:xeroderma pigmentosum group C-complementing protein
VFRRRAVHVCRTADAWYRRGRDVNEGEQPLKRAAVKRRRNPIAEEFDDDGEAAEGTALYAEFQTSIYEPPPVVNGKIPRNAYGNLDVYVSSMIPQGAAHIRHPLASKAARILGVDYAEAVTGFQFKGRQGTAVIDGVVVSIDMTHAMLIVIEGLELEASEEVQEARRRIILAIWKRWLTALRVREHVQRQYGDQEDGAKTRGAAGDDEDEEHGTYRPDDDDGGGFMLDQVEPDRSDEEAAHGAITSKMPELRPLELPPEAVQQEIIVIRSPHKLPPTSAHGQLGSHVVDDAVLPDTAAGGGFIIKDRHSPIKAPGKDSTESADQEGGGFIPENEDEGDDFLPEDEDEGGGGFLPEDEKSDPKPQATATTTSTEPDQTQEGGFLPEPESDSIDNLPDEDAAGHTAQEVDAKDQPPKTAIDTIPERAETGDKESPTPTSSQGSLLSHDPEEDDAEPEWLLNSLGEIE